ncbi:putative transposase insO for insertion sequence element IS911A [Shigella flexneri K-315]|uniref:Putative transposase insO for insertion sequence element IS911A n=1 Tax=Shigella flexneri K-315 TaxID=766150 RepID=I6CVU4_SHIFL|nr:putative transposase insO for insertion sequence element IS911A [Shigella flexneri K-315]
MVTLCQVFGVHRSSYRYWKNRPRKTRRQTGCITQSGT